MNRGFDLHEIPDPEQSSFMRSPQRQSRRQLQNDHDDEDDDRKMPAGDILVSPRREILQRRATSCRSLLSDYVPSSIMEELYDMDAGRNRPRQAQPLKRQSSDTKKPAVDKYYKPRSTNSHNQNSSAFYPASRPSSRLRSSGDTVSSSRSSASYNNNSDRRGRHHQPTSVAVRKPVPIRYPRSSGGSTSSRSLQEVRPRESRSTDGSLPRSIEVVSSHHDRDHHQHRDQHRDFDDYDGQERQHRRNNHTSQRSRSQTMMSDETSSLASQSTASSFSRPRSFQPPARSCSVRELGSGSSIRSSRAVPRRAASTCIEIAPGVFEPLRGADESWQAFLDDFYLPTLCMGCGEQILCIKDALYVICPQCKTIGPMMAEENGGGKPVHGDSDSDQGETTYGIGLGMTVDTLARSQHEMTTGLHARSHSARNLFRPT